MKLKAIHQDSNKSGIIAGYVIIGLIAVIIVLGLRQPKVSQLVQADPVQPLKDILSANASAPSMVSTTTVATDKPSLSLPISGALARVTKKPFGLYVSPKKSPVQPEHFTGYHTGVDFETGPKEQDTDVPVYAICSGPLVLKKIATGYGGVAVQSCKINKAPVTIIYGHLRLTSVNLVKGALVSQGQKIGVLGKGYSKETAGERKHLHLGIHEGIAINLLGYVPSKDRLSEWIDFLTLVK